MYAQMTASRSAQHSAALQHSAAAARRAQIAKAARTRQGKATPAPRMPRTRSWSLFAPTGRTRQVAVPRPTTA